MAKLELQNLRKEYANKVIPVKNITLEVEDGEFLTLLGPSGCGKSTLLRLIAGLEQPTEGRIVIGEKTMNKTAPGDRNIAMVFQSYALYPHMSVAQNISTSLKLRKLPAQKIQSRVNDVASKLGLKELLDRKPSQLSGGQRQRVALARALVRRPDVFLLDEPLSNLDALLREQVRAQLKQLFEQQSRPVVYVTHDQTEAMTLSSKVAVLYDGLIQQLASPHLIYNHPANQFVAGFVGSPQMNFLVLRCEQLFVEIGKSKIYLPEFPEPLEYIILGIRPEDVSVELFAQPSSDDLEDSGTIEGKVFLEEALGKEKLISVQVVDSQLTIRALVNAEQDWDKTIVRLKLPAHKIHWFSWNGDPQQPLHQRERLN